MDFSKSSFNPSAPPFDFTTPDGHKTKTKASTYTPNDIHNESDFDTEMKAEDSYSRYAKKPAETEQKDTTNNTGVNIVALSHLSRFVHNKRELYDVMTFKAQLFLPPFDLCTMSFMGQILSK